MLTENQINGQLEALAEERRGYEMRRAGAEVGEPMRPGDNVELLDARLAAVDERAAWLRGQSNAPHGDPERTRAATAETRPRGRGKQTRS